MLTILTNAPECPVQRTRHSRDDGMVAAGEKVRLADRSGLVFGHAVVGAVEDGGLTLEGSRRSQRATGSGFHSG